MGDACRWILRSPFYARRGNRRRGKKLQKNGLPQLPCIGTYWACIDNCGAIVLHDERCNYKFPCDAYYEKLIEDREFAAYRFDDCDYYSSCSSVKKGLNVADYIQKTEFTNV